MSEVKASHVELFLGSQNENNVLTATAKALHDTLGKSSHGDNCAGNIVDALYAIADAISRHANALGSLDHTVSCLGNVWPDPSSEIEHVANAIDRLAESRTGAVETPATNKKGAKKNA